MAKRLAERVLLIGLDAADWRIINPLRKAGELPALQSIIESGVIGNLATLDPPLSPMLWTSIGTGKTADQHGILGFLEPDEEGKALRPVLGTSRSCKAVWNILSQEGLKSNVVGWWPSHPAEPIKGAMVSNFFQQVTKPPGEPWPLAPGSVHPKSLEDALTDLRVHIGEITEAHLLPFVPRAQEVDQERDRGLVSVAKIIAEMSSVHAAATWLMRNEPWDLTAVYYDGIDHFGHGFMRFHPPRRPGVPPDLYELYNYVVTAGYRFQDMMVGRLLELAGPDTTVVICSDHGFHPDHLRPRYIPKEPAGPAVEHREYGIFIMAGPGIRKGARVTGADLLDITPTLLTLFGIPVGRDMPGRTLIEAFEEEVEPVFIESWEDVDGGSGRHPKELQRDPWAERMAMKQLEDLGYVEPGDEDEEARVERFQREADFYLARVYLQYGQRDRGIAILEALQRDAPDQLRYGVRLAQAYLDAARLHDARTLLGKLEEEFVRQWNETVRLLKTEVEEGLERSADEDPELANEDGTPENGMPEGGTPEDEGAKETNREDERSSEEASMGKRLLARVPAEVALARLSELVPPELPGMRILHGLVALADGDAVEAMSHFRAVERVDPGFPGLALHMGNALLAQNKWEEAEAAFMRALTIDPDSASAHHGLSISLAGIGRLEEAADAVLRAIGLKFSFPAAHFTLGETLARLGYHREAVDALQVCVAQEPGARDAHLMLAEIYRIYLDEPEKARKHLDFAEQQIGD